MEKLNISNIRIYQSFKQSPYTIETAIAEFIDNSVNSFNTYQDNNTIIIYWNIDENWLQIIDNGNGIDKHTVKDMFKVFNDTKKNGIGMKAAGFFLGNRITVESKNTEANFAFKAQFDLNKSVDGVPIVYTNPAEILRSFKNATRITIDGLNKNLSTKRINTLYFNLSKLFKKYIDADIDILLALVKDKTIHDLSEGKLNPVASLNEIKRLSFKIPEHNSSLTVNFNDTIDVDDKSFTIRGHAYKFLVENKLNGILLSNKYRTIIGSNHLYKPSWFDNTYQNVFVDLEIHGLDTNITKNWFNWNDEIQNAFDQYIQDKISHLKNKNLKKTQSLVDVNNTRKLFFSDETEEEHLETSRLYLTKALNIDENTYGNDFEIIKDKLHFTYNCDDGKKIAIRLSRRKEKENKEWLQLISLGQDEVEQNYEFEVIYNIAHPFFKPFDNDRNFSHRMEHFIIAYAISETICRLDGLNVNDLKYEISKILKGMDDDF